MKTVKYLLAFFFVFLAVSITGCSHLAKTSAEKAIKKDLDLLKNLDSETTMKYISYQELFPDSDDNTELSDDIKEVFSLFFQNFDYKILDISIDQDQETASAHLRLTTLDSQALAKDFITQSLKDEILKAASSEKSTDNDGNSLEQRYLHLHKLLKKGSYKTIDRNASIQLINMVFLHPENFIINISHIFAVRTFKILFCDRLKKGLDVIDGQNIFEVIYKNKHKKMIPGIFLLFR